MSNLREGTKVKTVTGLVGTVEAIYDMGTVVYYIVKIEDGSLYKFFEDQLTEVEEAPEEEPTESDTITITREEFRKTLESVTQRMIIKMLRNDLFVSSVQVMDIAPILGAEIENNLFGAPRENV